MWVFTQPLTNVCLITAKINDETILLFLESYPISAIGPSSFKWALLVSQD